MATKKTTPVEVKLIKTGLDSTQKRHLESRVSKKLKELIKNKPQDLRHISIPYTMHEQPTLTQMLNAGISLKSDTELLKALKAKIAHGSRSMWSQEISLEYEDCLDSKQLKAYKKTHAEKIKKYRTDIMNKFTDVEKEAATLIKEIYFDTLTESQQKALIKNIDKFTTKTEIQIR